MSFDDVTISNIDAFALISISLFLSHICIKILKIYKGWNKA